MGNTGDTFFELCYTGDLDKIKQLIKCEKINIYNTHMCQQILVSRNGDLFSTLRRFDSFTRACQSKNIHLVKYLIGLYKINKNYQAINIHLTRICILDHLTLYIKTNIIKYLSSVGYNSINHLFLTRKILL